MVCNALLVRKLFSVTNSISPKAFALRSDALQAKRLGVWFKRKTKNENEKGKRKV